MTTTYGTSSGSATAVGARIALTLVGAAGLIVGAFMDWTRSIPGTKLDVQAFWTTDFQTTETFVRSAGFAMIVVGLVGVVGLAMETGWLTRLAGAVAVVGFVLFAIEVYRSSADDMIDVGAWLVLAGGIVTLDRGLRRSSTRRHPARRAPSSRTSSSIDHSHAPPCGGGRGTGHRLPTVPRPLRIGVQLPEVERDVRWPEYVAMAVAAEEVGFDSIWVGDHLLYRDDGRPERGPWEAWTLLAGLAAVTRRVTLGPLVACVGFHPPAILAKMAATVDEVSGGRLVVAVGAGWNRTEFDAFGVPFDHRASRFEEAFEIVRRLLAGERVTLHGAYHDVDDAVLLPTPSRRPSLMVGSGGERVLSIALPHVDAWNTWFDWYGNTPEGFAARNAEIDGAATLAGRDPREIERSACVRVVLDRTADERPIADDIPPLEGPPERIAHGLHEMAEAGADEVILVVTPITEASIRELGHVVALTRDAANR